LSRTKDEQVRQKYISYLCVNKRRLIFRAFANKNSV